VTLDLMSNNKTLESQHSGCKAKLDKAEAETRQYMEMVKKFKRRAARAEEAGNQRRWTTRASRACRSAAGRGPSAKRKESATGSAR
jgi:hypothetical protein